MKKLLLSFLVVASATMTFAQVRNIDWSTETILTPASVNSLSTGTPFPLEIVFKNNGTSSALIGDSIWWQFFITPVGSNTMIWGSPSNQNTTTYSVIILNKNLAPGDTMHFNVTINAPLYANTSNNITMIINSLLVNRSGSNYIANETTTGSNNQVTKNIVWYNQQGWGVGLAEVNKAAESVKVYPNPAQDVVNFSIDGNVAKTISIMDITGKSIEIVNVNNNDTQINVGEYSNGIYLYQIKAENGQLIKSGKFNVSK